MTCLTCSGAFGRACFESKRHAGSRCSQLYPAHVTQGLRQALEGFEQRMPGFVCDEALLHGVETRTSAPVQVRASFVSFVWGATSYMVDTASASTVTSLGPPPSRDSWAAGR